MHIDDQLKATNKNTIYLVVNGETEVIYYEGESKSEAERVERKTPNTFISIYPPFRYAPNKPIYRPSRPSIYF